MPKSRISVLALILILILAAILRIGWPGLTEFKYDEAQMYRSAVLLLREGRIPVRVLSSVAGLPYPPLMVYLLALPLIIVHDPAAAVIFMALLGVGAVALTYALGAKYYSQGTGLIAAALFAAAPWAVFYSRKIWAQDVPLFSIVLMLGLYAFVIRRQWWGIITALVMAMLVAGFHLGNLVFFPIIFLALILHPRAAREAFAASPTRERTRWLIGGALAVIILLIGMLPWIVNLANGQIGVTGLAGDSGEARSMQPIEEMRLAAMAGTGFNFHAMAGDKLGQYDASLLLNGTPGIIDAVLLWLVWIGAGYVVVRAILAAIRKPYVVEDSGRYVLLALWLIVPVLVWTISRFEPQPHRYIAMYPAQHLAVAVLLTDIGAWITLRRPNLKMPLLAAGTALCLIVIAWEVTAYSAMMRLVATTVTANGHGPAAKFQWDAAREARRLAAPDHLPVGINGTGDTPDVDTEAAGFDALLGDLDLRLISGETVMINSPRGFVHLTTQADAHYAIEVVPPADTSGESAAKLANGIEFMRIEPSGLDQQIKPGKRIGFTAVWRVWGLPPTADDYSYSVQLFDENWLRYGNINDHFLRTIYWRVGDEIATSGILTIPGDAPIGAGYHLVLTLYTLDEAGNITPVGVVNQSFNKIGEFVDVSLK